MEKISVEVNQQCIATQTNYTAANYLDCTVIVASFVYLVSNWIRKTLLSVPQRAIKLLSGTYERYLII